MADHSAIEWTDATWNPWHGCIKVSPGCKNCYMYTEKKAYGQDPSKILRSKTKFYDPIKWKDPAMVFTCSWSDFFIEQADEWRPEAWEIIRQTPHLTYQILTKRPERIAQCLPADWKNWLRGYPNVWLGTSIENQEYADERLPELLRVPAAVHFASAEPLLGAIDLRGKDNQDSALDPYEDDYKLDWVIVGGESGPRARSMFIEWADYLKEQCTDAGVAFFMKQLGSKPQLNGNLVTITKKGGDPSEWPASLRVRQFPGGRA